MIARSTGAAPRQRGSSDGCTLSHSACSSSASGISSPYAATTIASTSADLEAARGVPAAARAVRAARRRSSPAAPSTRRPRPAGASGRVSRNASSWRAARRSRTSAPNCAVAATPMRRVNSPARIGRGRSDGERLLARGVVGRDRGSACRRGGRSRAARRARDAPRARAAARSPFGSCPSSVSRRWRSTGIVTPCIDRQPSSSVSSSSLSSDSTGLTTATTSSSPRWKTKTRWRMPTCVAARPTPRASCISWRMRVTSRARSSSNDVDLVRAHPQHGIAVLPDLRERELPARRRLGVELRVLDDLAFDASFRHAAPV